MSRRMQPEPFIRKGWKQVWELNHRYSSFWLYELTEKHVDKIYEIFGEFTPIMSVNTLRFYQSDNGVSLIFLHKFEGGKYANLMEYYDKTALDAVKKLRDCV